MQELDRLTAKYGLAVTDTAPKATEPAAPKAHNVANGTQGIAALLETVHATLAKFAEASTTTRARAGAEAYIRAKGRPALLDELYEALKAGGVEFMSERPKNTLSAILGQTDTLESLGRERGWWLKGQPEPIMRRF